MKFFPDMKTVVSLGGLTITWYAVLILSAAFLCYYLSLHTLKKQGYKTQMFEDFFVYMLPLSILGARIWYVIFEWSHQQYYLNPIRIFYIWEGGLAIHGGFITAVLFGLWFFRKRFVNGLRIADAILPNLLVAQAIGRWGNFINQEAFGGIVSESYFRYYPSFIKNQMYINGAYRQPTFLFEGIGNLIGFILITFVYKKHGRRKRGDLAFAYLAWYGAVRFMVEGMRTDSLMAGNLRVAQLISIIGMIIGILGIIGVWDRLFHNIWPFQKKKPALLFDLDGTLVDTKELIFQSFRHVFEKYKPDYKLNDKELLSFLGPTLRQSLSQHFKGEELEAALKEYESYNKQHHEEYIKSFPHVKKTLAQLKEDGYAMAVVSNKRMETIKAGLQVFDLQSYFEVLVDCDMVEKCKPDPEGLLKACEMLYHPHDDMIYIGDSTTDIEAAKKIAAFSVAVLFDDHRKEELKQSSPCRCISHFDDLLTILKEDVEWSDSTIL